MDSGKQPIYEWLLKIDENCENQALDEVPTKVFPAGIPNEQGGSRPGSQRNQPGQLKEEPPPGTSHSVALHEVEK
jgi:hypothetical protein